MSGLVVVLEILALLFYCDGRKAGVGRWLRQVLLECCADCDGLLGVELLLLGLAWLGFG